MTYSRDYPDVDPSVHSSPITHRECTGPFLLSPLLLFLFPSANASIIVAPTIFHRSPFTRKKPIEIEKPFRRLGMQNEAFCRVQQRPLLSSGILFGVNSLNN